MVRVTDIHRGFVDLDDAKYVDERTFQEFTKNYAPTVGDTLFTRVGSFGNSCYVNRSQRFCLGQNTVCIKPQIEKIDPYYLYCCLNSPHLQDQIISFVGGASQPTISLQNIRLLSIPFPALQTQQKIAVILSTYDVLIENNIRRIKILEEIAQAIYREWFVDFRFPGHEGVRMVESELGAMPEGWEVRKLREVCFLTMGQSPNSEFYNENGEGLPFHQGVTNFGSRFPIDKIFCTITNRVAEAGDILFSVRAPVGRINLADKKIVIGRGLSAIRNKNGNQLFTYHQLKELFIEEDMIGGGTIFKSVTKEDVSNIKVLTPNGSLIKLFEEHVEPISSQLDNLIKSNVNLHCTCNLLLPKLISGEIDVSGLDIRIPDAEA